MSDKTKSTWSFTKIQVRDLFRQIRTVFEQFVFQDDEAISEASMSGPIIAAIAGGSFVGLLLIGVALYFLCFKKPDGESYRTNDKTHPDDEGEVSNDQTVQVKAGHHDHNYHMVASTLKSENEEKKYFIWT